jgi:hypothetical protein
VAGTRVRLKIEGFDEFGLDLAKMPEEMTAEAQVIVWSAGRNAEQAIREAYPKGTGELRKGMRVDYVDQARRVGAIVRNLSPHAHLFEYGTQERHTKAGLNRGRMPPAHVFVPTVMRARRRMQLLLLEMIGRFGFRARAS